MLLSNEALLNAYFCTVILRKLHAKQRGITWQYYDERYTALKQEILKRMIDPRGQDETNIDK